MNKQHRQLRYGALVSALCIVGRTIQELFIRLVNESTTEMRNAVEASVTELIAADVEDLGRTTHPIIFKAVAQRIRSFAWRKP